MDMDKKIFCRQYRNTKGEQGLYFTDEHPHDDKCQEIEGFDCWVGDWQGEIIQETNVQEK